MRTNQSSGWEWHRKKDAKLAQNRRDNDGRCDAAFYGCLGEATQVHHRVERIDGGDDSAENLIAVCEACHTRLTTEANQKRAAARREQKKKAKRRNHPGRKDRYDS